MNKIPADGVFNMFLWHIWRKLRFKNAFLSIYVFNYCEPEEQEEKKRCLRKSLWYLATLKNRSKYDRRGTWKDKKIKINQNFNIFTFQVSKRNPPESESWLKFKFYIHSMEASPFWSSLEQASSKAPAMITTEVVPSPASTSWALDSSTSLKKQNQQTSEQGSDEARLIHVESNKDTG